MAAKTNGSIKTIRETATSQEDEQDHIVEPLWPLWIAFIAVGGLYYALPPALVQWPRWLPLIILGALTVPKMIFHVQGHMAMQRMLTFAIASVITVFMLWSMVLVVLTLPQKVESPGALLRSAAALWLTNVLIFAIWYWYLDAGGPHRRSHGSHNEDGAFLFPQMTQGDDLWVPHFLDYVFLSFNTSTALSPTDTSVLSRWAKVLMMLQAGISLTIIAVLAARAINTLP